MKILITGGAGFIGSNCVTHFAHLGHEIIGLDNLSRSNLHNSKLKSVEHNWKLLSQFKNVELIFGDIVDGPLLVDIFKKNKIDVVIHAAAQSGVKYSIKNPPIDFNYNVAGTFNVLEATRLFAKNATFIFLSTNKVYGENVDCGYVSVNELRPTSYTRRTPFGTSKYAGDIYTQEYGKTYGLKTGVFRLSCIYGPKQYGFEDQGWIAHLVISNYLERDVTIYGDGNQVRDLLYISDLIDAFDKFITSDLKEEVFNVGGGLRNSYSVLEVLRLIGAVTGKVNKISFEEARLADQMRYVSDNEKIKDALGWRPEVDFKTGLNNLVTWVKENEDHFTGRKL